MSAKEQYRILCQSEPSIPIYSRDWWLDIVCCKQQWDVLLATENDTVLAALPYYKPCRKVVSMPFYTQTMGPWFRPETSEKAYRQRLTQRQEILKQFCSELTGYSSFLQNFSPEITDWLPFYWAGFQQTTRYTYILEPIQDKNRLWQQISTNIRRNITRAKDKYQIAVRRNVPTDEFLEIQARTFQRQHLPVPHGIKTLKRLIEICRQRKQGDIWGGYDNEGRLHAAAFIVWQDSSAYYLAGGGNPDLRKSGAHSLVLWTAIQDVAAFTDKFDFEGSMLPGVERFFREFGAKQCPFFTITKGKLSLWDRVCIKVKNFIKTNRY